MVAQKSSIQTWYYVTTLDSMSVCVCVYIYIYRHTHTDTHICNIAVTNTISNYQNIQGLFIFSNLSPPSTLMYHIYPLPFPYIFFISIYIYIYILFLSLLKPISLVIVIEKFQLVLSIHVCF